MASKRREKAPSTADKAETEGTSEDVEPKAPEPSSASTPTENASHDSVKPDAGEVVEASTEARAMEVATKLIKSDATLIVRTIDKRRSYVRGGRSWTDSAQTVSASGFRPEQLGAVIFDRLIEVRVP